MLVRLKTSKIGSMVAPPSENRRDTRRSQEKNPFCRRSVLRVRMELSAQIRSAGRVTRAPRFPHCSETGEGERIRTTWLNCTSPGRVAST